MAFVITKGSEPRKQRISLRLTGESRWRWLLPASAGDLAARLGVGEPSFFWTSDSQKGYWAASTDGTPLVSDTGRRSVNGMIGLIDPGGTASSREIVTSASFADNVSCAFVGVGSFCSNGSSSVGELALGNVPSYGLRLVPFGHVQYCVFYAQNSGESFYYCDGPDFSNSGAPFAFVIGWDNRIKKAFAVRSGVKNLASGAQIAGLWASLGNLGLRYKNVNPAFSLMMLAQFSGADAESIADNAVSMQTKANAFLTVLPSLTSSNSIAIVGNHVNVANTPQITDEGLVVNRSVTNLMAYSYAMSGWTATGCSIGDWKSISVTGNRTLAKLTETAVTGVHKGSTTITPVSTGQHVIQFDVLFGAGLNQVCCEVDNGTDMLAMSLDSSGQQTAYATDPAVEIESIGTGLYRVTWPVTLTTTAALTLRFGGLEAGTFNDEYLGNVSKAVSVGNWCVVYGAAPTVCPVSIGSPATAAAPIYDWTDSKALARLKNGRLSCDFTASFASWPEEDVVLWTWRKDANNAIEVWLRYDSTVDSRLRFLPKINVVTAGVSTQTALSSGSYWVMQNNANGTLVETLHMSVSIGSGGSAVWWARSEAGQEIELYEEDIFTSGTDTVSSYVGHVPASIRLGSSVAGTGQQSMIISGVQVW